MVCLCHRPNIEKIRPKIQTNDLFFLWSVPLWVNSLKNTENDVITGSSFNKLDFNLTYKF